MSKRIGTNFRYSWKGHQVLDSYIAFFSLWLLLFILLSRLLPNVQMMTNRDFLSVVSLG